MTWQVRLLPPDDRGLYLSYLILGESVAATARHYGCDESSVRRRIKRFVSAQERTP